MARSTGNDEERLLLNDARLDAMGAGGIDVQVISATAPGVTPDPSQGVRLARDANNRS